MSYAIKRGFMTRCSNIELLRIIAMLAVVAHHYVVFSGEPQVFNVPFASANAFFLQIWGMWGKTAINVFLLISGYFMCTGTLTLRRYLKLLMQVIFYAWVMWVLLCCCGCETWSSIETIKRLILYNRIVGLNEGFTSAFLWMYLTIPVMNLLLQHISKKQLYLFLALLITMFTGVGTFGFKNVYHHVFWYMTLYLLGGAIRLHPFQWMARNKVCVFLLLISLIGGILSVVCENTIAMVRNSPLSLTQAYYFVSDSHKLFAFAVSFFAFLVFKNWKIGYSKFINTVASTCFGVLLIHGASYGMSKWLWQDFVNVPQAYSYTFWTLVSYSVFVALAVFAVCSALDYLRIKFIEKYYLDLGEKLVLIVWKKLRK